MHIKMSPVKSLQWRNNGRDSVSNHQPLHCLLNGLFRHRSKKTSKLRFTGLCVGNSPVTGEFPAQMASNAENVSIWWRHHGRPFCPGEMSWLQCHWLSVAMIKLGPLLTITLPEIRFNAIWIKYKRFFWRYHIWKCRLQNGSHCVQGSVC